MESETAVRTIQQDALEILESISDAIYTLDCDDRLTYLNRRTEELWGRSRAELLGRRIWDVFPQAEGTHTHAEHQRAIREGKPVQYQTLSPVVGRWIEVNLYPSPTGLTVYFRDISERKRAEDAAQDALRVRDEVLSTVSHDLRNPLTAIKGQAQLLQRWAIRRDVPENELLVRGLDKIDAAATRMSSWIEELLDVTRMELGQDLPLRLAPTDLVALVVQAIEDHQQTTTVHVFRAEVADPAVVGEVDAPRIRRVLDNLLSNAIKYSPAGGQITVRLHRDEGQDGAGWAVLSVSDPGVGIPKADQPHIFERFHRGRNVSGRIAGTGLGLAGSCRIVRQHGGSISVHSRERRGTTFTVRLPLGATPAWQCVA